MILREKEASETHRPTTPYYLLYTDSIVEGRVGAWVRPKLSRRPLRRLRLAAVQAYAYAQAVVQAQTGTGFHKREQDELYSQSRGL
jgi:hypothetical protein